MTPEDTIKPKVIIFLYQARAVLQEGQTIYAHTQNDTAQQLSVENC